MFEFLLKIWALARPYRFRMFLGVVTGVISGLFEPLMIATVVFVYSLVFPSPPPPASLGPGEIAHPARLAAELSHPTNALAQYVWTLIAPTNQQLIAGAGADAEHLSSVMAAELNRLIQCDSLYKPQFITGVNLSKETRLLEGEQPQGEKLILLNRLLLQDAFPEAFNHISAFPVAAQMPKWAPEALQEWAIDMQHAFSGVARAHHGAAIALVGLIPLVILLRGVLTYLNIYLLQWVAIRAIADLRERLFGHLLNLSASFFSSARSGELMARVVSDASTLQGIFSNATPVLIKDPVTLISLLAYLLWKQPKITLISMVVMPLCMVPVLIYNRKVRRSARAMQTAGAELGNVMAEAFTGYRVVKAYNLEQTVWERFRATSRKHVGNFMRIVRASEVPGPLLEFFGAIGLALVLIYLMAQSGHRPNSASFLSVILAIFSMYRPLKNLTRLYNNVEQARAASQRLFELLATPNSVPEPAQPKPLRAVGAAIHFDGVEFSYQDKPVVRGINLTVQPGQLVALVGSSGSGKTTLTNLLLRFYDPQQGAIRIGGTDIREVTTRDLRSQIAVVTQETILFNETIGRNIELGRPGATQEEIIQAARHAHAYDFIMEKPGGFAAQVGEKGVLVSGGQRQRLAIARAILKDAPILILDEATSSLDTESERAVQAALDELMRGRTTICVAHRLSTIQGADLIVVLDQGSIVETGTHRELMQKRGVYFKLHELQFRE